MAHDEDISAEAQSAKVTARSKREFVWLQTKCD